MKVLLRLHDTVYPDNGHTNTRSTARGILFNDSGKLILNHLRCDDPDFGYRDYYEIPGGGVWPRETLFHALKRELVEETGVWIKDEVIPVGRVIDEYNVLKRINDNHYFICYADKSGESYMLQYEKDWIVEQVWVTIDEAIALYENVDTVKSPLGTLVVARELPILKRVKEILSNR